MRSRTRPRVVLVFGEDENDTKAIAELLAAICPELAGSIRARARPPILIRDARLEDVPSRAETISAIIDVEGVDSEVTCVFAHEDCDSVEPAHEEIANKIEEAFRAIGRHVHAVTPAWELETWWFQWPAALAAHRPSWRRLPEKSNRDFGQIVDAKEELRRALRLTGRGKKTRDYSETDSPGIARKVRELEIVHDAVGKSASFQAFVTSVSVCCAKVNPG